jgi:drug/metabolite transporter (DMT)-like permease
MRSAPLASPAPAPVLDATTLGLYGAVVLVWGVSWIALKAHLGVVAPEVSALWRFMIAAGLMGAWVWARGERMRFPVRDHAGFALVGLCMFSFNFVLFYYGGAAVPSGLLAVVFSLASVMNLLLGAALFGQRIEGRVALGALVGTAGVGLLFWPEIAGAGFDRAALAGLGLCTLGTLLFCCGNLVTGRLQRDGVPVLSINAWGMAYSVAALAAVSALRGQPFIVEWTPRYLGALLFLAVFASVIAFACYGALIRRIGPARGAYATVLFPLVALTVSTLVEGYAWTALAAAGAACALVGNVIVLWRPAAR